MSALVDKPNGSAVAEWESEVRHQMQEQGGGMKKMISFRMLKDKDEHYFRHMDELQMYERDGVSTEIPIDEAQFGFTGVKSAAYATRMFSDIFREDNVNFSEIPNLAQEIVATAYRKMDKICFDAVYEAMNMVQDPGTDEADGVTERRYPRPSVNWRGDGVIQIGGTDHTAAKDNFKSPYKDDSNVFLNYNAKLDEIWGNSGIEGDAKNRPSTNPTRSGIFNPAKNVVPLGYNAGKNYLAVDAAGKAIGGSNKTSDTKSKNAVFLSWQKLVRLGKLLDNQNVPDGPRFLFVTPDQCEQLLYQTEVQSADYNTVKSLVSGDVNSFAGFTFVKVKPRKEGALRRRKVALDANQQSVLGLDSTIEVTDSICWIPRAMGGVTKNDFTYHMNFIAERLSHQIVAYFKMGAFPIDLRGIFAVPTISRYQ